MILAAVVCLEMFGEGLDDIQVTFYIFPFVFHDVRYLVEFISSEYFDFVPRSN